MVEILEHMSALSDPTRCRMLLMLEQHELTVSELCAVLQMPQSSVSRHLKTLADDNWVSSRRDATSRYYTMPLDDLDSAASRLWPLIREQVASTTAAAHDGRRLRGVLDRRRVKSQEFFATAAGKWDRLREGLFGDTFYLWAVLGLIDPTLIVGDLGCGTGQLTETIARYVRRVIAVDGSGEMLDAARKRLADLRNVEIRKGELEALPIKDGELDAAMLSLVLHYSPDPSRTLTEVARVCRPGAKVLVLDMLPHHHEEYQQQMGHVWLGFSEKQIVKFLTGAGFQSARVRVLPVDPEAKGPALFAAIATRGDK
ncbi:MAG TPA: metalloregulator ArsR/SmtB family transcription factor [Vicinamibacterales bacterium]|jgi:ubiquinone/menaquinone biosynthesis C-methylase UbiE|nr:metalloregulator ArsR/SmtB family transcription factor [Vicinamibacterales bacterium]